MQEGFQIAKFLSLVGFLAIARAAQAEEDSKRPVDGIMDNSFLVEEAYNQEAGVVQHIFTGLYGVDKVGSPEKRTLDLAFTQEWPVFSQTHQFSYTVPYSFASDRGQHASGVGDVFLNYRYQAYLDEKTLTAFAPRFSLLLPTGAEEFSNDTVGYQWNLPFSTALGDRWFVHANAGLTFLPNTGAGADDLLNYNLGASAIYCVSGRFNLMLEWIGTWNQTVNDSGAIDRDFSSVISPGVRYAFNFASDSQLVLGLGAPIGVTPSAPAIGVIFYLSFEHRFAAKRDL
jgi:hypothetical protein